MLAMDTVTQYAVKYGLQALVAIGIFVAGTLVARWAGNLMQQATTLRTIPSAVPQPPVASGLISAPPIACTAIVQPSGAA